MTYIPVTSDTFNRADGSLTSTASSILDGGLGGVGGSYTWSDAAGGGWTVTSNRAINTAGAANHLAVATVADVADCQVSAVTYGSGTAVVLRFASGTSEWYQYQRDASSSSFIYHDGGGVYNVLDSSGPALADGDTMTLRGNGTTLTCLKNATPGIVKTDASIATGKFGLYSGGGSTGFDNVLFESGTPPAVATKLGITTAPVGNQSGVSLTTQPVIAVQDAGGATVTSDTSTVTASITVLTGSVTLGGTTSKAAVAGVATFTNLAPTGTGSYTLTFSDGALTTVTTGTLWVGAAALHITSQPTTAYTQRVHGNVVVAVRDGGGVTVGNATNSITIAFTLVSKTGVLTSGTTTRSAVAGSGTFNDLLPTIEDGATWTYAVSASGLTGDTSSPITGIVRSLDVTDVNT